MISAHLGHFFILPFFMAIESILSWFFGEAISNKKHINGEKISEPINHARPNLPLLSAVVATAPDNTTHKTRIKSNSITHHT
jgi:hypothetical protein